MKMASSNRELPPDWVKKESKSKPGHFYYSNKKTGVSVWRLEDVFACASPTNGRQDNKINCNKTLPKSSSTTAKSERGIANTTFGKQMTPHAIGLSKSTSTVTRNNGPCLSPKKRPEKTETGSSKNSKSLSSKSLTSANESSKCSHSLGSLLSKSGVGYYLADKVHGNLAKKKSQDKIEEQEAKFEQLVSESASNSEYIDLETPLGTKDIKPVKNLGKFTGPKACLTNRNHRFVPFKLPKKKGINEEKQAKPSKSDQNLLFGKPKGGKSLEKKTESAVSNTNQKPATIVKSDSSVCEKTTTSCTSTDSNIRPNSGKFKSHSTEFESYPKEVKSYSNESGSYSVASESHSSDSKLYLSTPKSYSSTPKSYSSKPKSYSGGPKSYSSGSESHSSVPKSYSNKPELYSKESDSYSSQSKPYSKTLKSYSKESKPYSRESKPYSRESKSFPNESKSSSSEVKYHPNKVKSYSIKTTSSLKEISSCLSELEPNIKSAPNNVKSYFNKSKSYPNEVKSAVASAVAPLSKSPSTTSPAAACKSSITQCARSYSLDGDWEMVSDEEVDEGGDNDIALVSFALNSDVVMSDSITASDSTAERLRKNLQQFKQVEQSSYHAWVCLVMDTCSMGNLQNLLEMKSVELRPFNSAQPVEHGIVNIVIPWQVLQELDHLKDNKAKAFSPGKSLKARRVAKLIYSQLQNKTSLLKLQSPLDDASEVKGFRITTEDDHIIKCCLSLKNKFASNGYTILLVTEDINLINKMSACDLLARKYQELTLTRRRSPKMADVPEYWAQKMLAQLEVPDTTPTCVVPSESMQNLYPPSTTSCNQEDALAEPSSVSALANITSSVAMPSPKIKEALGELEEVMKPVLSKCLVDEMCAVFGDVWLSVIYKPPPWDTLLPVLECLHKHWMAVFGMVVMRHSSKYVKTLLDTYSSPTHRLTSDKLTQTVIAATALLRSLDRAGRGYSPDARTALPALGNILDRYKADTSKDDDVAPVETSCDVGAQLTEIFTQLGVNCDNVKDSCGARQASEVVFPLGIAYNAALSQPTELTHITDFIKELYKIAQLLSIKATFTAEDLSDFIANNRELMLQGLKQLEHIATVLQTLI